MVFKLDKISQQITFDQQECSLLTPVQDYFVAISLINSLLTIETLFSHFHHSSLPLKLNQKVNGGSELNGGSLFILEHKEQEKKKFYKFGKNHYHSKICLDY